MDCVVDLVTFNIEGTEFNIKEYCLVRLENCGIKDFRYGVVRPSKEWYLLPKEAQRSYEFLYEEYGIDYFRGIRHHNYIKKLLKNNLNQARTIYVKNSAVRELVRKLIDNNTTIVTLDSIGFKFDSKKLFRRCCYHEDPRRYRCAIQDAFAMADFVVKTVYFRINDSNYNDKKKNPSPGKILPKLNRQSRNLFY